MIVQNYRLQSALETTSAVKIWRRRWFRPTKHLSLVTYSKNAKSSVLRKGNF